MIDFLGYTGLAVTLFALNRNSITELRIWSILGLFFFLSQSVFLENTSLIVTNITFFVIHFSKLVKNKLDK